MKAFDVYYQPDHNRYRIETHTDRGRRRIWNTSATSLRALADTLADHLEHVESRTHEWSVHPHGEHIEVVRANNQQRMITTHADAEALLTTIDSVLEDK